MVEYLYNKKEIKMRSEIIISIWENIIKHMKEELYADNFSNVAITGAIKHHKFHNISLSKIALSDISHLHSQKTYFSPCDTNNSTTIYLNYQEVPFLEQFSCKFIRKPSFLTPCLSPNTRFCTNHDHPHLYKSKFCSNSCH